MINILFAILGVVGITILLGWVFHFVYRWVLVYVASDLSREIQGILPIQKPPLKNLVHLVVWLKSRRDEIVEPVGEDEDDEKYRNTYG